MDDPDHELAIYDASDWRRWRSGAVKKEPWTFDWLKRIGTGVLYDVGACVGSYSLMAAARGATVVAFEPVPWNFAYCVANVHFNRLAARVTVLPVAAGAEDGTATLAHPAGPLPGFGQGGADSAGPWTLQVPQIALRNCDLARPTHVKIDVEGAEIAVLRGMDFDGVQSLIVELADQEHEADAAMILQAAGFRQAWKGGERTDQQRTAVFDR
jgi:FkbM family methyltransferase